MKTPTPTSVFGNSIDASTAPLGIMAIVTAPRAHHDHTLAQISALVWATREVARDAFARSLSHLDNEAFHEAMAAYDAEERIIR